MDHGMRKALDRIYDNRPPQIRQLDDGIAELSGHSRYMEDMIHGLPVGQIPHGDHHGKKYIAQGQCGSAPIFGISVGVAYTSGRPDLAATVGSSREADTNVSIETDARGACRRRVEAIVRRPCNVLRLLTIRIGRVCVREAASIDVDTSGRW